jgi:hypothetical protein
MSPPRGERAERTQRPLSRRALALSAGPAAWTPTSWSVLRRGSARARSPHGGRRRGAEDPRVRPAIAYWAVCASGGQVPQTCSIRPLPATGICSCAEFSGWGCVSNGTRAVVDGCRGQRETGSVNGQAAANSAMRVAQRHWNTRRRPPRDTTWPERATARKYWRFAAKAGQQRAAESNAPKPRITPRRTMSDTERSFAWQEISLHRYGYGAAMSNRGPHS